MPLPLADWVENPKLLKNQSPAEKTAKREEGRRKLVSNLGTIKWSNSSGMRFGRLVVVEMIGRNSRLAAILKCRCDCGSIKDICCTTLRNGHAMSCGCLHSDVMSIQTVALSTKHGCSPSNAPAKVYVAHQSMMNRCHRKGHPRYSGRGITVCDRWRFGHENLSGFECFWKDMGDPPSSSHSIDRINNDLGYSPENCRWATKRQQTLNRSNTLRSEFNGSVITIVEISELTGISYSKIYPRIKRGMSADDAVRAAIYLQGIEI